LYKKLKMTREWTFCTQGDLNIIVVE